MIATDRISLPLVKFQKNRFLGIALGVFLTRYWKSEVIALIIVKKQRKLSVIVARVITKQEYV